MLGFETSAKNNINIDKIFHHLVSQLIKHKLGEESTLGNSCIITRDDKGKDNKSSKCDC